MEVLTSQLNAFRIGDLRLASRTWEIMMERDGDLGGDADKRFDELAGREWEVMPVDKSPEAQRHADALRYFYDHLRVTSALEQDETGDVSLMLYQMATAHAHRYSVHEMLLRVDSPKEYKVTAQMRHTPVWFFEARRGYLGYLAQIFDVYGQPLLDGEWVSCVGKGWMRACSVAYWIKHNPLADWLMFSRRFGLPGIHGETDAQKGSKEWDDFSEALATFSNDWVTLTNKGNKINLIEAASKGNLPFSELVELVNRLYSKLFRGADLASNSRMASTGGGGNVVGASVQGDEKDVLGRNDVRWATGVLNARVDTPVLRYLFNTEPKAFLKIIHPDQDNTANDLQTAQFGLQNGMSIGVKTARERFNWPEPEPGEPVLTPVNLPVNPDSQSGTPKIPISDKNPAIAEGAKPGRNPQTADMDIPVDSNGQPLPELARSIPNSADLETVAATTVATALKGDLYHCFERLRAILQIKDSTVFQAKMKEFLHDFPNLEADILADPSSARALAQAMSAGIGAGIEAAQKPALANYNDGEPRDSLGKWVDANGGGLSEHDNIQRGQKALDRALRQKADVQKAMYRKEVGQIDFLWGTPGIKAPDENGVTRRRGGGISHMAVKHGDDLKHLPETLAKGRLIPHRPEEDENFDPTNEDSKNKRFVIHGDHIAIIKKSRSGNSWAVTHYKNASESSRLENRNRPDWLAGH